MKITISSDFMCPFCSIGEADFEHADDVEIEYKSFLLQPEATHDPAKDYYETFTELKGILKEQGNSCEDKMTLAFMLSSFFYVRSSFPSEAR